MTDAAAAALSPMPPPAIRIEKECLHDAEEAGNVCSIKFRPVVNTIPIQYCVYYEI